MHERRCADGGRASDPLSLDTALEAISHYQRREILCYLRDSPDNVQSLDAIIEHLIDIETERGGSVPGEDHLLSVLVHVHAPKLDTLGIISYDITSGEVQYYPNEKFERVLEQIDDIADDW